MLIRFINRLLALSMSLAILTATGLAGCFLESSDRDPSLAALASWEDQRLAPQDSLVAMLRHDDAHIRLAAVRTAGLIGRSDVLPQMVEALDDQSPTVVRQAAFSLGLLGDDAAVEALVQAARDPHTATRVAALRGLAHLQHDGQAFLDAVGSKDHDEAVAAWDGLRNVATSADSTALSQALLTGLQRVEADVLWRVLRCSERTPWTHLITPVAPHAQSSVPQVRVHAMRALARMDDQAALDAVIDAGTNQGGFRDRNRVRVDVAMMRALGSLAPLNLQQGEAGEGPDRDFLVTALITGAGSENPHLAVTALAAMEKVVAEMPLPPEAAQQESLLPVWRIRLARAAHSHLDHEVADVRAAAIRAWALLRGSGSWQDIVHLTEAEQQPRVVAAGIHGISRIHPAPLMALGFYSSPESGKGPLVRTTALEGLDHVFRERPDDLPQNITTEFVIDRLTAAAADEDFVISSTAADLLGNYPARLSLTALVELWDSATGPGRSDQQLSVLGALESMGQAIVALERPDTTGYRPDRLLDITRQVLRESFDSTDVRIRYKGREAARATGLLPEQLIPTEGSLLATLPAFVRSKNQAPLTLPFDAGQVRCITDQGEFIIKLNGEIAPNTCATFLGLIRQGFYDNLTFHRVVPDFVVQGGCPRGDGWGGPGFTIRSEWSRARYLRSAVGIAHSGKDTGGSQFFVTLSEQPHLNGRYTIFGEVTQGMEVVDLITPDDHFRLEVLP